MQLFWISFCIWLAIPKTGYAQQQAGTSFSEVASVTTTDFQLPIASDSGKFCVETVQLDSLGRGLTRVYYPSGKLQQYIPYSNVARKERHGCVTTWYDDGRMFTKEEYMRGVRHGVLLTYYPNGVLRRRELYVNGHSGVGVCYNSDGRQIPFFAYEQLPLYPGGNQELMMELKRGMHLTPQEMSAMRRESQRLLAWGNQSITFGAMPGWKRQVDVELTVAEDGRILHTRVASSDAAFLNNAAERAVTSLKRKFVPARRDGMAVKCLFTVPVNYTLAMPPVQPARIASRPVYQSQH